MDKKRLLIFPILFGVVLAAKLIAPHYSAQPIPGLGLLYTIVTLAISFFLLLSAKQQISSVTLS